MSHFLLAMTASEIQAAKGNGMIKEHGWGQSFKRNEREYELVLNGIHEDSGFIVIQTCEEDEDGHVGSYAISGSELSDDQVSMLQGIIAGTEGANVLQAIDLVEPREGEAVVAWLGGESAVRAPEGMGHIMTIMSDALPDGIAHLGGLAFFAVDCENDHRILTIGGELVEPVFDGEPLVAIRTIGIEAHPENPQATEADKSISGIVNMLAERDRGMRWMNARTAGEVELMQNDERVKVVEVAKAKYGIDTVKSDWTCFAQCTEGSMAHYFWALTDDLAAGSLERTVYTFSFD